MAEWSTGSRLGPYELVTKLGEGQVASVWLARAESSGGICKQVALKLIKGPVDEDVYASIQREGKLMGRLQHPNIVDVLGVETHDGSLMVSLEYLGGGTLRRLISQVKTVGVGVGFPQSVVVDLGVDVLRGLSRAHGYSGMQDSVVLHRDLKPENVLLDLTGRAKVTDFGLAKVIGETSKTAPGIIKGTHRYVAPEVWRGARDIGPMTDLFAVGCILFELITLRRLFQGSAKEIMEAATSRTADEEARWVAEVAPDLAPVVANLLRRDPAERYQCAEEVIDDLQPRRYSCGAVGDTGLYYELIQRRLEGRGPSTPSLRARLAASADPGWAALANSRMA